ncbi:AraC family transcriptional regulator [Paucibacter sp. R3-3]|uniref:AraC family transcriptional regulator n=1 Tax=Roseateles agri TaxID=3098619 RepID=A0ABU5DTZ8_9BURK|nr:AraC family transcriptional regulator [Paucibacter sp. R3-3]MDY0749024.1 AraC family transcriptional regulator [Paucibacter sp. R3-3]
MNTVIDSSPGLKSSAFNFSSGSIDSRQTDQVRCSIRRNRSHPTPSGIGEGAISMATRFRDADMLIADIANLAKSYMDRNEPTGPTASTSSKFDVASEGNCPKNDEGRESAESDKPHDFGLEVANMNAGAVGRDREELLDAVLSLLGLALQQMRNSPSPETGTGTGTGTHSVGDLKILSRPRGGIAPSALRRVREYIDKNLSDPIEVNVLASLTGLSLCHFSRAFKQSMGMPPHRYLICRRIKEAARLIECTEMPMYEIALEVGFSDQSHFTRVFSAQLGESPSRFRHQRR